MKKLSLMLLFLLLCVFLAAGSATAIPTLPTGYEWSNAPYWTITDLTTNANGSSFFQIQVEIAAYESDFGLFTVDDFASPSSIKETFQVFSYSDEPYTQKSIYFSYDGSNWKISDNKLSWSNFSNVFGIYYGVHTGADATLNYTFYSDSSFNSIDKGITHVMSAWNGIDNAYFYLEDLPAETADWDWEDMTVLATDVAPVPEPATMLLFGVGLCGLAFVGRKKLIRHG